LGTLFASSSLKESVLEYSAGGCWIENFRHNNWPSNNTTMAAHAPRLARLFSPTFARAINAQIVYPATSQVINPNELECALAKPLHKAHYQPESSAADLAASLSYGIIKGRLTRKNKIPLVNHLSFLAVGRTPISGRQQKNWFI
jgi:hypothetical protein